MVEIDSLLSLPKALELAGGISDATRRRMADFPKPVVLLRRQSGRPGRIAFVESEVRAWVRSRIEAERAEG